MTYKISETVLAAAVAATGTFTIQYPDGTQAGSFAGAHAHKLWVAAHQFMYTAPGNFTLTFGASNITVTLVGSTFSIPAGSRVKLQLDVLGDDSREANKALTLDNTRKANVVLLDLGSPVAAVTNGIGASQSVTGAGTAFVLNGSLVVGGVAVFDTPRNVVGAWTGTAVLTFTGKDVDGTTVVESSASGTSHTGKKAFKSITSVTTSASITAATVGTGVILGLPRYVADAAYIQGELMNGVALPRPAGKVFIPWEIEQIELLAPTAEQIVCPVAGWISKVRGIVQGAVTTGGVITVEVNTVAVTGLTFTVADADAAGVRYSDAPTTRHGSTTVVAAGDAITITPSAPFATAGSLNGVLEIDVTAAGQLDGTFVAGVTTAATATTGDTRGTYSPAITPDGTLGYLLVVALPDPANKGVAQYAG